MLLYCAKRRKTSIMENIFETPLLACLYHQVAIGKHTKKTLNRIAETRKKIVLNTLKKYNITGAIATKDEWEQKNLFILANKTDSKQEATAYHFGFQDYKVTLPHGEQFTITVNINFGRD